MRWLLRSFRGTDLQGVRQQKGPGIIPALSTSKISSAVLAPLDLGDLVGLGAAGGDDFHGRALLLADQRAR